MVPSLLQFVEKKATIHQFELLDPSVLPAPFERHKTALFFAWMWDWGLALFVSYGLIGTWDAFLGELVYPFITSRAEANFAGSADSLVWILASLTHFSLSFWGLAGQGQTFGMKVFKHVVSAQEETLTWQEAMLYAAGSTVCLITAGFGIFLLDQLVLTQTQTTEYHFWKFCRAQSTQESAPNLVDDLMGGAHDDFEQAA